jgi:hypothetical protein
MYFVPGLVRISVKPVCLPILPGITAAVGYFDRSTVSRAPRSSGFRPNGRHLRSFSAAREEAWPGQEERFLAFKTAKDVLAGDAPAPATRKEVKW